MNFLSASGYLMINRTRSTLVWSSFSARCGRAAVGLLSRLKGRNLWDVVQRARKQKVICLLASFALKVAFLQQPSYKGTCGYQGFYRKLYGKRKRTTHTGETLLTIGGFAGCFLMARLALFLVTKMSVFWPFILGLYFCEMLYNHNKNL